MLHTETVEAGTMALIRRLSEDPVFKDFVLVGGTALALQLGHRKSIDIDLFTEKQFDTKAIADRIGSGYKGLETQVLGEAVFTRIDGVKTDMIAHRYPWLTAPSVDEGVRMASLEDIAAMKLHAIVVSGRRLKDYVDAHYLLEHFNLQEMLGMYERKYADGHAVIARNALLYHKDINFRGSLDLRDPALNWPDIKRRLEQAAAEPKTIFPADQTEGRKEELGRKIRRGRRR